MNDGLSKLAKVAIAAGVAAGAAVIGWITGKKESDDREEKRKRLALREEAARAEKLQGR